MTTEDPPVELTAPTEDQPPPPAASLEAATAPQTIDEPQQRPEIKALQEAVANYWRASGTALNGQNINPLPIIIQQKVEMLKLTALIDEFIAERGELGTEFDNRLATRIAGLLNAQTEQLLTPRIALGGQVPPRVPPIPPNNGSKGPRRN